MQTLEQLNRQFAIEPCIQFVAGQSGMPMMDVQCDYASARIALYGGQVLSYKPHQAVDDLLFLSDRAIYEQGSAIRGGIPVCWPWFGDHPEAEKSAHGFARNLFWDVAKTERIGDKGLKVTLKLESTATSKQWWPYDFQLFNHITISDSLNIKLETRNTGKIPFYLSEALHTYLKVGDITQTAVAGLESMNYLDKTDHFNQKKQVDVVTVVDETDRIYLSGDAEVKVVDKVLQRAIRIKHDGADNMVVWNPNHKAAELSDLMAGDDERFICVESANALANSVCVKPGEHHSMQVQYKIEAG